MDPTLTEISISNFSDITIYLIMGVLGTALFLIKMGLMLFFGADVGDFDVGDGAAPHGEGFGLFSTLSIIAFMMGAGWLGLAARAEWGWGPVAAAAAASAFGFSLMAFSSWAMWQMKKFNVEGKYDVQRAVGRTGRVYLLTAKSSNQKIESFTTVKVLEVQDGNIVLVEPI
jgi:hypothetical protein